MSALDDPAFLLPVAGTVAALAVGLRRGNVPAVFNAAGALVIAVLPTAFGLTLRIGSGPGSTVGVTLSVWLAVAGFLHAVGMLGPYDDVWWWDHLTHTVSAALVAALLYGGIMLAEPAWLDPGGRGLSRIVVAAVAIVLTVGLGLCWEFAELLARAVGERVDVEPVLEVYGRRDTALDLVFDAVGAVAVVLLDPRLSGTVERVDSPVVGAVVLGAGALSVLGLVGTAALTVGPWQRVEQ